VGGQHHVWMVSITCRWSASRHVLCDIAQQYYKRQVEPNIAAVPLLYIQHSCSLNAALRDAVHIHYQGVLYSQNLIRCHCTSVHAVLFTSALPCPALPCPVLPCTDCHQTHQSSTAAAREDHTYQISHKMHSKYGKCG